MRRVISLPLFFFLAYVAQGVSEHFCLLAQPLEFFLLKDKGMDAAQISAVMSLLMFPWIIKPLYACAGFVPGFRSWRKLLISASYLLSALSLCALFLGRIDAVVLLVLSDLGLAVATVLMTGMTAELGNRGGNARTFFGLQAQSYYPALICASLLAGWLCHHFAPAIALAWAGVLAAVPCLVVSVAAMMLPDGAQSNLEEKTSEDRSLKGTVHKPLLIAALFLFLWNMSPGFGTPLYVHFTNTLHFSQSFIGQLLAVNSVGMLIGATVYKKLEGRLSVRTQAYCTVFIGTISTLGYLFLSGPISAVLLDLLRGFANIVAIITIYGLAADVSKPGKETVSMAILVAINNVGTQLSGYAGGFLYAHVLANELHSLIVVSALFTALCAAVVPFLPVRGKAEPAKTESKEKQPLSK